MCQQKKWKLNIFIFSINHNITQPQHYGYIGLDNFLGGGAEGSYPTQSRMFSSIPSLYTVNIHCTPAPVRQPKVSPEIDNFPLGAKLPPVEN